jgi:hypothetical protein
MLKRTFVKKHNRLLLALVLLLFSIPLSFFLFHTQQNHRPAAASLQFADQYPGPRHQIHGFRYESNIDGKKRLSLKASKVSLQKKKIGFFRFGLMNELRIDDALFTLYGFFGQDSEQIKDIAEIQAIETAVANILPQGQAKSLASLVIEPIVIEFHSLGPRHLVSQLQASRTVIQPSTRRISFEGKVVLEAGDKILETDTLYLDTETNQLQSKDHYVMRSSLNRCTGNGLVTDFLLQKDCFKSHAQAEGQLFRFDVTEPGR